MPPPRNYPVMPAGLPVEVIAKVPSRYCRVPWYFFHGTYCGAQLVVPPNTTSKYYTGTVAANQHVGPDLALIVLIHTCRLWQSLQGVWKEQSSLPRHMAFVQLMDHMKVLLRTQMSVSTFQ